MITERIFNWGWRFLTPKFAPDLHFLGRLWMNFGMAHRWYLGSRAQESDHSSWGSTFSPFGDASYGRGVGPHPVNGRSQLLFVSIGNSAVDDTLCPDAVIPTELADPVMMQKCHRGGNIQAETFLEIPNEMVASLANVARNADVLWPLKVEREWEGITD